MSRLPCRIRPRADRDLDDHVHYLREHDPAAALRFIDAAFDAFQTLSENPEIGAPRHFDSPAGHSPSAADGQIAAIARVNELVLVTANVRDFRRFEGLSVQNWSR